MLSRTVGLLSFYFGSMFWMEMLHGIDDQCANKAYNLLIRHLAKKETSALPAINKLYQDGIGGLIWRPQPNDDKALEYLRSLDLPFVLIDTLFDDPEVSYVTSDNASASNFLVSNLLKLDKGPVVCVSIASTGTPESSVRHRIKGYMQAVTDAGANEHVIGTRDVETFFKQTLEYACQGARCFFMEHSNITVQFVDALEANGSFDLSEFYFADFDDDPVHYREKINCVTAIQQGYEMGRTAMKILYEKQKAKVARRKMPATEQHVELSPSFVGHGELKTLAL